MRIMHLAIPVLLSLTHATHATVTNYLTKPAWQAAVNNDYHTLDFTGFPADTIITTQYANVGVTITESNEYINISGSYLNDGAGLASPFFIDSHMTFQFAAPQFWLGVNFPGNLFIKLYQGNSLLYSSTQFGISGTGNFGGLVSDQPFDRAVIYRPDGSGVYIDDLFYSAVPAPGAFVLLGGILLCPRSRRRSDS